MIAASHLTKDAHVLIEKAENYFDAYIDDANEQKKYRITYDLLFSWRVNAPALVAIYLLPIFERQILTREDITQEFSVYIAQVVVNVSKRLKRDQELESREKTSARQKSDQLCLLFTHVYTQIDVAYLCVSLRVSATNQLNLLDEVDRENWAKHTLEVYLPVMRLMGLNIHADDVGDLCLDIIDPAMRDEFINHAFIYYKHHEKAFGRLKNTLYHLFERQGVSSFEVLMQDIPSMRLYEHIKAQKKQEKPFDLNAVSTLCVDILVRSERDCYIALGIIHNVWRVVERKTTFSDGRFHDYIASPLPSGYRALVTTVLYQDCDTQNDEARIERLVEFRIRTQEMEAINTHGIVAAQNQGRTIKNAWWENDDLKSMVRLTKTTRTIFVFFPDGRVIYPLRRGNTMVDLAFKIHSDLGPYAQQFWINGQRVDPKEELLAGAIVDVRFNSRFPMVQPEWESYATSSSTRAQIRRFLNQQSESPVRGRRRIDDVLKREMAIYEMRLNDEEVNAALLKLTRKFGAATLDELYSKVVDGAISPDEIVSTIIEDEFVGHIALADAKSHEGNDRPTVPIQIARCWMQERGRRKWDRATRVMPGAEIVGRYVTRGKQKRLIVYRQDSPNAPAPEDAVPLKWRTKKNQRESVEIEVTAPPRPHIIDMVYRNITKVGDGKEYERLIIHSFHADVGDNALHIKFVVDSPTLKGIRELQELLAGAERGGYITSLKVWQLFPGKKIMLASRQDKKLKNPFTLSKISNQNMFFGRDDEIHQVIENLNNGTNLIVLYGQKRIGKSSLLFQLAENMLPAMVVDTIPVSFDAHNCTPFEVVRFLKRLIDAALKEVWPRLKRPEDRRGLRVEEEDLVENPFMTFAQWVKRVESRLQGAQLLFMIDEFTTAEDKYQRDELDLGFFDGMQWLVDNYRIRFLLCVHDHVLRPTSGSWELLQRGHPIPLRSLSREAAGFLIQRPLEGIYKFSPGLVDQILDLTNCHPYFIHMICHEIIKNMSMTKDDLITEDNLQKAISIMLLSGDHYFNHYRSHTDEFSWEVLKIMAYASPDNHKWLTRDEIRDAMISYGHVIDNKLLSKWIGDLIRADIIESRHTQSQALYRIPVGLFRIWLRQVVTHPIVSKDLQQVED